MKTYVLLPFFLYSSEFTLALEKEVNKALLNLHSFAEQNNDPQFCDYLEGNFLNEQVEGIFFIYEFGFER